MAHPPVVAHVDSDIIRASRGVADMYSLPVITIKACYGVPRAGSSSNHAASGSTDANGDVSMNGANGHDHPASNRSEWLIGDRLETALREEGGKERIEVRWPFTNNQGEEDWEGREFVLLYLYSLMDLRPSNNTAPLLLVPPAAPVDFPLSVQEHYCQMAFENLNVPQLAVLPSPLAALFAMNAVSGAILHIGRETSEVNIAFDSVVRWEVTTSVNVGEADCERHLEKLLLADEKLDKELKSVAGVDSFAPGQKEQYVREIREFIFAECTGDDIEVPLAKTATKAAVVVTKKKPEEEDDDAFDVAKKLTADAVPQAIANPSHKSKKALAAAAAAASKAEADAAAAAEAADIITVTIPSLPEKEIIVGSVRHRLAEPLLLGTQKGGDTVWEAIGRAIESPGLNTWERLQIWDAIGVIGNMAKFKTLPPSIVSYLSPYLLTSPDLPSDSQPARLRLLNIPDYMANFKGQTSDLAPFLGASMVAKPIFNETQGKHSISKADYNAHGPSAIYGVWQD